MLRAHLVHDGTLVLAFTGTQTGMTVRQKSALRRRLVAAKKLYKQVQFHHGDCIGADAEAHAIALEVLGIESIWIHPGDNPKKRAYCKGAPGHVLPVDGNLDRNRTMVRLCAGLIAAPDTMTEKFKGSGTWMTIREARDRQKKPFTILEP